MAVKGLRDFGKNLTISMWSLRFASSLTPAFDNRLQKMRELFPLSALDDNRVGNRRSFDAVERLLSQDIVYAADPNETLQAYHESI